MTGFSSLRKVAALVDHVAWLLQDVAAFTGCIDSFLTKTLLPAGIIPGRRRVLGLPYK